MRCKWGLVLPRVFALSTFSSWRRKKASWSCIQLRDRHKQTNKRKIFQNLFLEKKLSYTWCRQGNSSKGNQIQCLCILNNKNKHSSYWHFCDEQNYSWPCWSSRNARRFEAQLEMQSRLKLKEMQQEGSHAHHQNCDEEQYYVPTLVVRCFGWNSPFALDPRWKAHASFALVHRRRVAWKKHQPSSWTEGFSLELLALTMLPSSPSSCRTAQTPYPELVKKAGNPFFFLSRHLASYCSTTHNSNCWFRREQERRQHCIHRDEKLRTHLQLLKWQRIALLLVLLLFCMMKKTWNRFFFFHFLRRCKSELTSIL